MNARIINEFMTEIMAKIDEIAEHDEFYTDDMLILQLLIQKALLKVRLSNEDYKNEIGTALENLYSSVTDIYERSLSTLEDE